MSGEMKWLAADVRARLLLFTVWNTAVETKLFSFTSVALPETCPRQSGLVSLLLSAERDLRTPLAHI
jgi:hypothetical protein